MTVDTGGFFAPASVAAGMQRLRDALRELPDPVFADLFESDGAYLVVIDLPGATAETVDVEVEDGRVEIEARRTKDVPPEFRYVSEERSLFLDVELPVPRDVAGHDAAATIDRGVLELELPKQSSSTETTVPVEER